MKSIGKYEVLDEIGASAAGVTYRARDNFRNRELTLKVLHPLPALDAALKEAFCRDLLLCSELTHRHLAKVLDLGEADGKIYIATAVLSGTDLRAVLAGTREMTISQKIAILAQACEGLGFAHSREVTHGAIKPSNIFVDNNSDVTIFDLGTAKWQALILGAGNRPEGLVANYFAPEQVLGHTVDSRSDLFSLALVGYELLAGKYPFQVPASLIPREIVHSEPEALRKVNPDIPEELEYLIARGLNKKPEERLQTAEEFAAGLYGIAQHLRRVAPAPTPVQATESAASETSASVKAPEPETKTPKRTDVQTGQVEQPWTARSYVAGPVNRTEDKAPSEPTVQPMESERALSPAQQAEPEPKPAEQAQPRQLVTESVPASAPSAQSSSAPPPLTQPPARTINAASSVPPASARTGDAAIPPIKASVAPAPTRALAVPSKRIPQRRATPVKPLKRRAVAIGLGAVLAIYLILNYLSHQGLHASQNQARNAQPVAAEKAPAPEVSRKSEPAAAPAEPTPAPVAEAPKAVEPPRSEPKDDPNVEQILRKQVKASWESGNYSEAMRLVDQVLLTNPANSEARTWKKRIRAAQEAEAAIK